jgi:hypothetical protein
LEYGKNVVNPNGRGDENRGAVPTRRAYNYLGQWFAAPHPAAGRALALVPTIVIVTASRRSPAS